MRGSSWVVVGFAVVAAACATTGSGNGGSVEAGANDGGGDGAESDGFAGTWQCTETVTFDFSMPVGAMPYEGQYAQTITAVDYNGTVSMMASSDSGAICPEDFTVMGSTGMLQTGAGTCAFAGLDLTLTYTGGTATLSTSTKMKVTTQCTFTGKMSAGSGTIEDDCTRM